MSSTTKRITAGLLTTIAGLSMLTSGAFAAAPANYGSTAESFSAAGSGKAPQSAAASAGCGTEQKPGNDARAIDTSDGERSYRINIPRDYEISTPLPLVLGFHGNGSDGAEFQNYTGLPQLPAITVFPDGFPSDSGSRSWQGAPYASGVDDVEFVAALLDEVESNYCVDLNRVYATGKSNGGGMVSVLACHLRDRFSAFAPVAGAYYPQSTENCDYSTPTPVLAIHGTEDATMHYEGGHRQGEDYPGVREWIHPWVEAAACEAQTDRKVGRKGEDVRRSQWTECAAADKPSNYAMVELYSVAGGGHVWPGEVVYSGGGYVTEDFSATDTVWNFFLEHPGTTDGPAEE